VGTFTVDFEQLGPWLAGQGQELGEGLELLVYVGKDQLPCAKLLRQGVHIRVFSLKGKHKRAVARKQRLNRKQFKKL
jgi:hypothetical protein